MLRVRRHSLGQYSGPYQNTIEQITTNFPACFTASSILPQIDSAINDGKLAAQQCSNNTHWYDLTSSKTCGDITDAVATAQSLRNRYASESPNTTYCNNSDATKAQHYSTVKAITGVYQAGAGAAGAQATNAAAASQFVQDANPINHLPDVIPKGLIPGVDLSGWQQWLLLGGGAFLLYTLLKKPPTIVVAAPEYDNE